MIDFEEIPFQEESSVFAHVIDPVNRHFPAIKSDFANFSQT